MVPTGYDRQVFVNCPFDDQYRALFEAILFTLTSCGFRPRCALENEDGSQTRIDKIFRIISSCRLGVHDISRTELDRENRLPRFNMPLELGMFLGAKRFGAGKQNSKICLILDRDPYRFQQFLSDIAGQDIRAHQDDPIQAIVVVRNWLRNLFPDSPLPGGEAISGRYKEFRTELPELCEEAELAEDHLTFTDYTWLISFWLDADAKLGESSEHHQPARSLR